MLFLIFAVCSGEWYANGMIWQGAQSKGALAILHTLG
jgi:hypothetical protein